MNYYLEKAKPVKQENNLFFVFLVIGILIGIMLLFSRSKLVKRSKKNSRSKSLEKYICKKFPKLCSSKKSKSK